jgi:hypothetical protein
MMFRGVRIFLSACCVALALVASANAADLTVASLNSLHLGWGAFPATQNKCEQIKGLMSKADLLFLQEAMSSSLPCTELGSDVASTCSAVKGDSTYREAYCFVYKTSKITPIAFQDAPAASFSRPPYAMLARVSVGTSNHYAWFADIHSIFGNSPKLRQAEANAAGSFFNSLATTTHEAVEIPLQGFAVVIGGDWNLGVTNKKYVYQPGFTWADPQASPALAPSACPRNDATSLTAKGDPASPYDHLIITGASLVGDDHCYITMNSLSGPDWRKNVSDHMAIYWGLTFN